MTHAGRFFEMRVAFLTPEYPSELPDAGGLATYVHRMAQSLQRLGHEVEVFVTSEQDSSTISYDGVPVHRVGGSPQSRFVRIGLDASRRLVHLHAWNASIELLLQARALAKALERRHRSTPFDFVQSADYFATGLFVARRPDRTHAVRCSYAQDLYNAVDKVHSRSQDFRGYLERLTMRRADVCYSPSSFLADYFHRVHAIDIAVVRPPAHMTAADVTVPQLALPNRFFIHFGMLIGRKGTDLLAEALPLAWETAPDLTMVWAGRYLADSRLRGYQSLWGERAGQIVITGPLPRSDLYGVLQKSDVAVLPSQVDNLPNTVIESLSFGIPVLGSRGASIDELVEDGVTGHLVDIGDVKGLAQVLAKMWNRQTPVAKGFKWTSEIRNEMNSERAVENLLRLCTVKPINGNERNARTSERMISPPGPAA